MSRASRKPLYRPLDWLMVRTPLLPVGDYLALQGSSDRDWPVPTVSGTALPTDPRIQRALAVGAGDLVRALENPPDEAVARRRLAGKLLRYLIRMSSRPTPYGTFAGVGLAGWGDRTDLSLAGAPSRTRTRPDMGWLLDFVAALENRPEVRAGLRWFANPAAFVRADRIFLSERNTIGDPVEGLRAVSLRATGAVRTVLEYARKPVPYQDLVTALTAGGAPREKVEPFLQQLWEQTVLLTDLRPPLTIAEPGRYVADRLSDVPAAAAEAAALVDFLDEIAEWDQVDIDQAAAGHAKLAARAYAVHEPETTAKEARSAKVPLQTDMALPLAGRLIAPAVAAEVARLAETMLRISPWPRGMAHLDGYRQKFEQQYGQDREVPLVELLDPKIGLGAPEHGHDNHKDAHPDRERALLDLALNAIKDGRQVVELDAATVGKLEIEPLSAQNAPPSLDVSAFVVATSAAAVDAGDFLVVLGPNLGASVAGRVLGRFADLLGPDAEAALRTAAAAETARSKGKLRAEVTYLPRSGRSANVAIRPMVRDLELSLGTSAGVDGDRVLPVDELVVGVRDGRFVVRWRDQEVVPCAGHMLNSAGAPAIVRFLDEIKADRRAVYSSFDWGPAAGFAFVPRVQLGRVVLAPARWRIDPAELETSSGVTFVSSFARWRERWQPPRHVYLAYADNRLLLDLDEPDHLEQLRLQARKPDAGPVLLHEALPGPDHAWVAGADGNYLSELVVPLILDHEEEQVAPWSSTPATRSVAASRLRPPGSDWLFAKLYFLDPYEEDLIGGPLRTLAAETIDNGLAESWFFMRYQDPEPHIRVRWHGAPDTLRRQLAPELLEWGAKLVADGYCERFCLDTYDQEVERYGGPAGMALAERLFAADSVAVADLLNLCWKREMDIERSLLGVYSDDDLLAVLGLDQTEREHLYAAGLVDRKETSEEFRKEQSTLRAVLGDPDWLAGQPGGPAVAAILAARREKLAPIATQLRRMSDNGEVNRSVFHLSRSFVHMHNNRLLGCGHPPEQRVLGLAVRTRESLARAAWRPRAS